MRERKEILANLSKDFSKERNLLVINSFLMLLDFFDIKFQTKLPFIGIENLSYENFSLILLLLNIYFIFRLILEWNKSENISKNLIANKIDFYISLAIGFIAVIFIAYKLTSTNWIWDFPLLPLIVLLVIGEFVASTTSISIENIVYIRSKNEALRLGLSRIPTAVLGGFIFILLNLLFLSITYLVIENFISEPVKSYWHIILFIPLTIHFFGLIIYFIFPNKEMRESLQKIFDKHDRNYQLIYRNKDEDKNVDLNRKVTDDEYEHILKELKKGKDPNGLVAEGGWTFFMYSVAQGDYRLAKLLLDYGADVNTKNVMGRTALFFAAKYGYEDIFELLINNGANVNVDDCIYDIPLIEATKNGHQNIVQLFVNHNVDVLRKDINNKRALEYAEENCYGDIAKILRNVEKNANKT